MGDLTMGKLTMGDLTMTKSFPVQTSNIPLYVYNRKRQAEYTSIAKYTQDYH